MRVTFDNKLKFEKHINTICQKANRKLNALARITPYIKLTKSLILTFSLPEELENLTFEVPNFP